MTAMETVCSYYVTAVALTVAVMILGNDLWELLGANPRVKLFASSLLSLSILCFTAWYRLLV